MSFSIKTFLTQREELCITAASIHFKHFQIWHPVFRQCLLLQAAVGLLFELFGQRWLASRQTHRVSFVLFVLFFLISSEIVNHKQTLYMWFPAAALWWIADADTQQRKSSCSKFELRRRHAEMFARVLICNFERGKTCEVGSMFYKQRHWMKTVITWIKLLNKYGCVSRSKYPTMTLSMSQSDGRAESWL